MLIWYLVLGSLALDSKQFKEIGVSSLSFLVESRVLWLGKGEADQTLPKVAPFTEEYKVTYLQSFPLDYKP